jgi:hypothetical protein
MANDLLKQAIADAKAVRETALANAKLALEEAFTPRIQSMLSNRIAEEEEMEEGMHGDEEKNEGMHGDEEKNEGMHGDKDMEEGKHSDMEEGKHSDMDEDMMQAPAEEAPAAEVEEDMDEMELEAIIKELEEEMEEVDEELDSSEIGAGDNKVDLDATSTEDPGEGDLYEGEEVDLEEVIKALREMEEGEHSDMEEGEHSDMEEGAHEDKMEEGEGKGDLEEAYEVIRFLRSKINEVNLLNAKLLFSNKLFRNHSLNESQKLKVIENFDRASNIREVKLIYSTLAESFGSGKVAKRKLKESYASKASASTAPKKVLTEGNELAARWNKLITYNR